MPNRIIKESICTSVTLQNLTSMAEILFYRLIVNCDDYGRLNALPPIIRAKCFPLKLDKISDADIVTWLAELAAERLIELYTVDGQEYLQMVTWARHQQRRAKHSKFPAPVSRQQAVAGDNPTPDSTCKQMIADDCNGNQPQANVPVFVFENRNRESITRTEQTVGGDGSAVDSQDIEVADLTRFIADEFIPGISAYQLHKITAWVDEGMTPGAVRWAVEQAMMANVRRVDYVHAILKNLADEGITTREAAETASASRRKAKAGKPAPKAEPEPAPEIVNLVETGPPEPVPLSPEWKPFLEDLKKKGEEKRREQLRRQYRGLENAGNDSG